MLLNWGPDFRYCPNDQLYTNSIGRGPELVVTDGSGQILLGDHSALTINHADQAGDFVINFLMITNPCLKANGRVGTNVTGGTVAGVPEGKGQTESD